MPKMLQEQALTPADFKKATGSHYTPLHLAEFVANKLVSAFSKSARTQTSIRVIDPAIGDGILLECLLRRLAMDGIKKVEVTGYDTNSDAVQLAKDRLKKKFPTVTLHLQCADFLDQFVSLDQADLFQAVQEFDLLIANPPYVRTQILGADQAQRLAERFGLSGRVDLAFAFIKAATRILARNGMAGIITSNRFMTTRAGSAIREDLQMAVDLIHVWDFGDTKLFEAAVLPAVVLFRKRGQHPAPAPKFTSIYLSKNGRASMHARNHVEAVDLDGIVGLPDGATCIVRHGTLNLGRDSKDVWRMGSTSADAWFETVKANSSMSFGDLGKVKVGVKTTADRVFIRSDWEQMPPDDIPELLRPLTTHHFATRWKTIRPPEAPKILYPHTVSGGRRVAVELNEYPRTARYLSGYRDELEGRRYVIESGRQWYEIWVPHDPQVWDRPKLVFRDIAERPTFWIDLEGTVINGDCYWMTCARSKEDLLWLALAVGNSSFIETFYDVRFNNKLYSSRRRFMTQYVEQFPLPVPDKTVSRKVIELAKTTYKANARQIPELEKEVDQLIWKAFGLGFEEVPR